MKRCRVVSQRWRPAGDFVNSITPQQSRRDLRPSQDKRRRYNRHAFNASVAIQACLVTSQFEADVVKICLCVSVERKGLRQHRDATPIPFSWAMAAKIMSRDGLNADLDEPRDGILVQVRMDANHQPRSSDFDTSRATVKNIETCLRVGGRGRNLRDRQQSPFRIAKGRQVSSGPLWSPPPIPWMPP